MGALSRAFGVAPRAAGSSGGSTDLAQALSGLGFSPETFTQPAPEPEPSGLSRIASMPWNFVKGAGEFAASLGHLASGVAGDVYNLGAEGLEAVGLNKQSPHDYITDDLVKGMTFDPDTAKREGSLVAGFAPMLQEYTQESYGVDLKDPLPDLGKIGRQITDRPFDLLLDATGVAAAAGGVASRVALSKYATGPGGKLDQAAMRKARPTRLLPGLGEENVVTLPDGSQVNYPGGARKRLYGQGQTYDIDVTPYSENIYKRWRQKLVDKLKSFDVEKIDSEAKRIADEIGGMPTEDAARRLEKTARSTEVLQDVALYQAAKEAGLTRVPYAKVRERALRNGTVKMLSGLQGAYIRARNSGMYKDVHEVLENSGLTPEEIENHLHKYSEGVLRARGYMGPWRTARDILAREGRWAEDVRSWLDAPEVQVVGPEKHAEFVEAFDDLIGDKREVQLEIDDLDAQYRELEAQVAGSGNADTLTTQLEDLHQRRLEAQAEFDAIDEYSRELSEIVGAELGQGNNFAKVLARLRWKRHKTLREYIDRGHMRGFNDVVANTYGPLFAERHGTRLAGTQRSLYDEAAGGFPEELEIAGETVKTGEKLDPGSAEAVRALMDADPNHWKAIRNDFILGNYASPLYFPQFDPRRLENVFTMPKRGQIAARVGSEGKKRSYLNYMNETYMTNDPAEAWARRMASMRRTIDTHKFIDQVVQRYGRELKYADDFVPGHEALFNPFGAKVLWRNRALMDDAIGKNLQAGHGMPGAVGQALKQMDSLDTTEARKALMDDGQKLYAVPKVVADQLEAYTKYQTGDWASLFFDTPTAAWRSAVLALSPRWIVNNLLGNVMFLKMQGGSVIDVMRSMASEPAEGATRLERGVSKAMRALFGDQGKIFDEWLEALPEEQRARIDSGLMDSAEQYLRRRASAERSVVGGILSDSQRTKNAAGIAQNNVLSRAAERSASFNNFIERHFRRASFATALERQAAMHGLKQTGRSWTRMTRKLDKIAEDGWTPQIIESAIDEMNSFFNDYSRLTPFERNVMRRFIAPFYSFYKHVTTLTLRFPIEHPARAATMRLMGEFYKELEPDVGLRPRWLEGAVPIGFGSDDKSRFLNTRNVNPLNFVSQIQEDPKQALGSLHPYAGMGLEWAMGEDITTGRPFSSPDVGESFGGPQFGAIKDAEGNIIGISDEETKVRPPLHETLLGSLPQSELIRDAARMVTGQAVGRRYDTGETIIDPATGQPKYPENLGQKVGQWLGFSTTDFDLEKYQEFQANSRRMALLDILRQHGYLPPPEEQ